MATVLYHIYFLIVLNYFMLCNHTQACALGAASLIFPLYRVSFRVRNLCVLISSFNKKLAIKFNIVGDKTLQPPKKKSRHNSFSSCLITLDIPSTQLESTPFSNLIETTPLNSHLPKPMLFIPVLLHFNISMRFGFLD